MRRGRMAEDVRRMSESTALVSLEVNLSAAACGNSRLMIKCPSAECCEYV